MKNKNTLLASSMLFLVLTACHSKKHDENIAHPITVKTNKVEYKNFAEPIVSSGIITSSKEARLSFKTGGIISRMLVEEGEYVKKGQLLATLNMTEVNAQFDQTQNSYGKAKRDYDRANNLIKDSAITKDRWENASTSLNLATASLKIASFNKQFSSIYANESGRIIQRLTNEGELVGPGAPVYIINSTNSEDWIIRIGVSDKDWARLNLSDNAEIVLDAYPGQTFKGVISKIEQASEINSGTFAIEVKVHPGKFKFANGLVGKVQIFPTNNQKVSLVPIDALQEANSQSGNVYSFEPKSKTAIMHHVRIAYILKNQVAVTSGLENVTNVITEGVPYLADKTPVEITN